jgi:hypothetical protein
MASVTEVPEIIEESQIEHSHATLPPTPAARRGFVSNVIALLAHVAPLYKKCLDSDIPSQKKIEMPVDILAREHPYTYIKALAG